MTTSTRQAQTLQAASLLVLWLQLLGLRQAQPLLLVALPGLALLSCWPPPALQRRRRLISNGLGVALGTALLAVSPLGERSQWLAIVINLLWLLSGFKLLEAERPEEIRRSGLLLLLAIGMAGVYRQALAASLLQGGAALLAVGSLLALEIGAGSRRGLLRRLLTLVGVSVPLMALLFVFGPRTVPYFQLGGGGAQTGLSEELDPGSIASLVQSDAPAMRLQFGNDKPPPPQERYWRIMTLSRFDGRRWRAESDPPRLAPPTDPAAATQPTQLSVLLEPTNLRWLAWSGTGLPLPNEIRRSANGGLWREQPQRQRLLYRLVATSPPNSQPWRLVHPGPGDLAYPQGSNPKLEALATQWRSLESPAARVLAAQRWFLQQGFRYTLQPGTLPVNAALDAFLFERREGFCEHFAAAFTALMRASDVPARVVVGYQGGEWVRPITAARPHLNVTQADAHAWSEVWLPNQGWTRVDPTAWVVPERTQQNLYDSLAAAGSSADQGTLREPPAWLNWLQGQWQALDLGWSLWVMQFDQNRQSELLEQWFGANAARWQSALLAGGLAMLLAAGLVVMSWLQPRRHDRLRRQLDRCLRRLNVTPLPGESLDSCLQRAAREIPELSDQLQSMAVLYSSRRFKPSSDPDWQRLWTNCLEAIKTSRQRVNRAT
ncbi:MAG: DUF3488 and transglutaminase-like domain-containing protein [Cyanobacteriota bacterium]|nr:DUF3488 and transglutaminase-like domain-containing protein [Cyanobacteriota bacterium]